MDIQNAIKSYDMEPKGFTSPAKEVLLRTFIALKIHRSQTDFNPRALDPMPSTVTTEGDKRM
jgi:hypothetical protein